MYSRTPRATIRPIAIAPKTAIAMMAARGYHGLTRARGFHGGHGSNRGRRLCARLAGLLARVQRNFHVAVPVVRRPEACRNWGWEWQGCRHSGPGVGAGPALHCITPPQLDPDGQHHCGACPFAGQLTLERISLLTLCILAVRETHGGRGARVVVTASNALVVTTAIAVGRTAPRAAIHRVRSKAGTGGWSWGWSWGWGWG